MTSDGEKRGSAGLRLLQVCGPSRTPTGKAAGLGKHEVSASFPGARGTRGDWRRKLNMKPGFLVPAEL